jgi:hypothetical protein
MARKKQNPVNAADTRPGAYAQVRMTDEQLIRLKQLALDERTTVADLLRDGINLVLKARKLPPL